MKRADNSSKTGCIKSSLQFFSHLFIFVKMRKYSKKCMVKEKERERYMCTSSFLYMWKCLLFQWRNETKLNNERKPEKILFTQFRIGFARPHQSIVKYAIFSSRAFVCDTPFILRRWPHFHWRTKVIRSPCRGGIRRAGLGILPGIGHAGRSYPGGGSTREMKQKEPRTSFGPATLSSLVLRSSYFLFLSCQVLGKSRI